jgi:hypothetical protein
MMIGVCVYGPGLTREILFVMLMYTVVSLLASSTRTWNKTNRMLAKMRISVDVSWYVVPVVDAAHVRTF